jgi:hypothetical protein
MEVVMAQLKALSCHSVGGTEKNHKKSSMEIAKILAEIQTVQIKYILEILPFQPTCSEW